jgi:L-rhamnose mutarotase
MNRQFSRATVTLAALFVGAVIGYACSEASRTGSPLLQAPTARAGEVKASKPRAPKALPTVVRSKKVARSKKEVQRFGSVIGLKREKQIIYDMLHAHPWEPINKMIKQSNIRNYSIYETELDGKLYLFAYFEYTGDDFEADMAQMAKDKTMRQWWELTDPCQIRLPGTPEGEQWKKIREVYHLD